MRLSARNVQPAASAASAHSWLWVLVVAGVVHALSYIYVTSDDAFISLRYAANIAGGLGARYNPGGPAVEGFSNPLFVFVCAALLRAGAGSLLVLKGLGLLALLACLLMTAWVVRVLFPERARAGAAVSVLLLAASPCACMWAVAGLETMLHAALVFAATALAGLEFGRRRVVWTPLCFVAVACGRPEGVLLAAAAAAVQYLGLGFDRRVLSAWTVCFVLPCALLLGLRYAYFGALLPNTAAAKVFLGLDTLAWGLGYLGDFGSAGAYVLVAAALLSLVGPYRHSGGRPGAVIVAVAVVAAQAAFSLLVGGDFMPGFRFMMPVYPLICVLAAGGITAVARSLAPCRRGLATGLIALSVAGALLWLQMGALQTHSHRFWLSHDRPWYSYLAQRDLSGTWLEAHQAAARYIAEHAHEGDRLALSEAGVMPFYSGLETIDLLGLNHRGIAGMWRAAKREERLAAAQGEGALPVRNWAYDVADYALREQPRWVVLDGSYPAAGSRQLRPRLAIGSWLMLHRSWSEYQPVFEAKVYEAGSSELEPERINVVFERLPRLGGK